MIQVRDLGDGTFAVIDGMHRVTCLIQLRTEQWLGGIDYEHVRHCLSLLVLTLSALAFTDRERGKPIIGY
jgi:hypothetical protein